LTVIVPKKYIAQTDLNESLGSHRFKDDAMADNTGRGHV
jgi:hypothetical protein